MRPSGGQRIVALLLAAGALAALPARAEKPGDYEQLATIDDATGLPHAFGGAHLGERERELESSWKGYARLVRDKLYAFERRCRSAAGPPPWMSRIRRRFEKPR